MNLIKSIVLAVMLLCGECGIHASTKWTRVSDNSQITDEGVYLLTFYLPYGSSTTKFYLYYGNPSIPNNSITLNKILSNTKIVDEIEIENIKSYFTIKFNKSDEYWNLYNMSMDKYIGQGTSNLNYLILSDSIDNDKFIWSINIENGILYIKPKDSNYYLSTRTNKDYSFLYTNNSSNIYPTLYKLTSYTLDESTGYTDNEDISSLSMLLNRSFTNNVYNSLILPCDVNDYKTTFGNDTQAYELSSYSSEENSINFTKINSNKLMANIPYLIKDISNTSPYAIGTVDMKKPITEHVTNGNCTYIGNYTVSYNLGGQDYYILNNDKFYHCQNTSTVNIAPFRCYFSIMANTNAKLVVNGESVDKIDIVNENNYTINAIYNMNGIKMKDDIKSLKKGIYIINGKKFIK